MRPAYASLETLNNIQLSALIAAGLLVSVSACSQKTADDPAPSLQSAIVAEPAIELDVPFVPTPHEIVASMLEMAQVGPDDHLVDLGSGDGRIVIAAVRDRGAKSAAGIDLDPQRVAEAQENATAAGVPDRVHFEQGDLFEKDFSAATVLTLYLTQDINLRLRPRILATLAPGTRVVSHVFDMGDWPADHQASMGSVSIFGWTVPARVGGQWTLETEEGVFATLQLEQRFQMITGSALMASGDQMDIEGRITGWQLSLALGQQSLSGLIDRNRIAFVAEDGTRFEAQPAEVATGATALP